MGIKYICFKIKYKEPNRFSFSGKVFYGDVTQCQNSSKYLQIPTIRELIDFKGDLECLKSKHESKVIECYEPFSNCEFEDEWRYNTTAVNKSVLEVNLEL